MLAKKILSVILLLVLALGLCLPAEAATKSDNPLLYGQPLTYVRTSDEFLNILLLGLDVSSGSVAASGNKRNIMESHTDVIMLISINLTQKKINMLSIPRDTLAYVPNIRGVYKINAAFNTGSSVREGFRHTVETVSWFLGGIRIDAYCALDLPTLVALGDVMGGIDFDMDMTFKGSNNRRYVEGYQHLDGLGIADYVRARTNAGKERTDLGRTNRGRKMVAAIFDRIKSDYNMLNELWAETQKSSMNFYTDLNGVDVLNNLWGFFQEIDSAELGSYVFSGEYASYVLGYYNMTITDQPTRVQILNEVFGIRADEIPYASKEYCSWLLNTGFPATQKIRQAYLIMDYAQLLSKPSSNLTKALSTLEKRYNAAVSAFDKAAKRMRGNAITEMESAIESLRRSAVEVAELCSYPNQVRWEKASRWYQDPMINEYYQINWE